MKLTIDTTEKTIELHGDVNVMELENIINEFNLSDYTIKHPKSHNIPFGTLNRGNDVVITPYTNIGPSHGDYLKNIPIAKENTFSDSKGILGKLKKEKILIKG